MFLKGKIFWQKFLKCTSEGIHFLVKLQALVPCSFALQALGLALSLMLMFAFASVAINVLPVAALVHSVIA